MHRRKKKEEKKEKRPRPSPGIIEAFCTGDSAAKDVGASTGSLMRQSAAAWRHRVCWANGSLTAWIKPTVGKKGKPDSGRVVIRDWAG